ncbi:hypothetical protein MASR1M36_13680 [Candidatus Cloacimonadaceae bacterium]
MIDKLIVVGFVLIVVSSAVWLYSSLNQPTGRDLSDSPAINYALDPIQIARPDTTIPVLVHAGARYTIIPKARYQINGVLVSKKRYIKGYMSWLSPWDYAIIWGDAPNYLPYLKFEQMVRYCMFQLKSPSQVDVNKIANQMGNNHLIPANPNLRKAMGKAQKHDLISLDGFLVNVIGQDRKRRISKWNTSLIRTDNGGGACEIIYVSRLRINNTVYE